MNTPIIVTGSTGLVGSRIQELLSDEYGFIQIGRSTGVDLADSEKVKQALQDIDAKIILHIAAKTDVDGCEDDKILGEEGEAWQVNVHGTENLIDVAKKSGKRMLYISTDFVFDGTKESYSEEDEPNPVNWYGETKYAAEQAIMQSDIPATILRIAYPYRTDFPQKKDFVRKILEMLKEGKELTAVTDHIFTPTFIDDIADAIRTLIHSSQTGIYHVVGSESLTTYDAIQTIGKVWDIPAKVRPVTRKEFFKDRAFRPFKLALKNDRIHKLGVQMKSFQEGLQKLKNLQ